jgi:hypothetical protein
VGESSVWTSFVNSEDNRVNHCKPLDGKRLFIALYGKYTVTLSKLKAVLRAKGKAVQ